MEVKANHRGFPYAEFLDYYDESCSLQISSIAGVECVWLGVDVVTPKMLASTLRPGLTGWIDFPLPEGVEMHGRMHLTREQIAELLPHLQKFVETGEI